MWQQQNNCWVTNEIRWRIIRQEIEKPGNVDRLMLPILKHNVNSVLGAYPFHVWLGIVYVTYTDTWSV